MTIANADQLLAAWTGAQASDPTPPQFFPVLKSPAAFTTVAGTLVSLWLAPGFPSAPTAGPGGTWATATAATTGAFPIVAAAGSHTLYVGRASIGSGTVGGTILYDRLGHMSGLSGTVVSPTAQTVNSGALPSGRANTNGIGVDWFLECFSQLGATSRTATIGYTDSAGNNGQTTTVTIPANWRQGSLIPIPVPAGKLGIKSIESVTLNLSTGTAGDFGVTAARRISGGHMPAAHAGGGSERGSMDIGLPTIDANTCLWLVSMSTTTSLALVHGEVALIEG